MVVEIERKRFKIKRQEKAKFTAGVFGHCPSKIEGDH
jgi:hypothetical protein